MAITPVIKVMNVAPQHKLQITVARIDSVNNRVIVAETFVYAPSKMKRSILRRLEASLYTLNMYPENDKNED